MVGAQDFSRYAGLRFSGRGLRWSSVPGFIAAQWPHRLRRMSGDFSKHRFYDGDIRCCCGERYAATDLHLVDAGGDLDEGVADGLEGGAKAQHQPVGGGVQQQPELVCLPVVACGTVRFEVQLVFLDEVLHTAAATIDLPLVMSRPAARNVGDDKAEIRAEGDHAAAASPTLRAVVRLKEPSDLVLATEAAACGNIIAPGGTDPGQTRVARETEDVGQSMSSSTSMTSGVP